MELTIDLASVSYIKNIVGEPKVTSIIPAPTLFACPYDEMNKLHVFGLGYLDEDMITYPFVCTSMIGGERFIGTTKDPVYLYPFGLLKAATVLRYNAYVLTRDEGKLERFLELSRSQAEKLFERLEEKYTLVAIPSLVEDLVADDLVRYKILGGNIYENLGVMWKHTTPYDVRLSNEQILDKDRDDKRKKVAPGKGKPPSEDNGGGIISEP